MKQESKEDKKQIVEVTGRSMWFPLCSQYLVLSLKE